MQRKTRACIAAALLGLSAAAAAQQTSAPPAKAAAEPAVTNEAQILIKAGQEKMADEKWTEAAALFEKAHMLSPSNSEAAFGLGTAYSQLGRYKESLPLLEQVFKAYPESPVIENNLAWVYAKAKDPEVRNPAKAIKLARDAVITVPSDYNIWSTLAEAYFADGQFDRALRSARNALELSQLAGVTNDAPFRDLMDRCEAAASGPEEKK